MISWYGLPSDGQGYSSTSQEYIVALARAGVDVRLKTLFPVKKKQLWMTPEMSEIYDKPFEEGEVGIAHGIPAQFKGLLEGNCKIKIGFTMFETNQIPQTETWGGKGGAIHTLNQLDAILTPSQYCKDLFEQSGVTKPIFVIHNGVNLERFPLIKRPERKTFTFLMLGTLTQRKNPGAAISAFISNFENNPDAVLIMKTQSGTLGHLSFPYKNLIIIDKLSTHEEILQYYRQADMFVFPSRGEGFGVPPIEAMATGIPAIIPDHTGLAEYAHDTKSLIIGNGELITADRLPTKWGDVGQWFEPSYLDLRNQMKYAYDHQDEMRKRGAKAAKYIREEFNYDKITGDIIKALKELGYGR